MEEEKRRNKMHNKLKRKGCILLILLTIFFSTSCIDDTQENGEPDVPSNQFATKARNISNLGERTQDAKSMFYFDDAIPEKLYKLDFGSEEPTMLAAVRGGYLNVADGMLYYIDQDNNGRIYRMNKDGGTPELICDLWCNALIEVDGKLFFSAGEEDVRWIKGRWEGNCGLYSMDIDGGNLRRLTDGVSSNIYPHNNYIYYIDITGDYPRLYWIDMDGQNKVLLTNEDVDGFFIADDWIYFSDFNEFFRMDLSGKQLEKVEEINHPSQMIPYTSLCVYDQYLIYSTDANLERGIHLYNMKTGKDKRISKHYSTVNYVIGNKLYYREDNQDEWVYKEIK